MKSIARKFVSAGIFAAAILGCGPGRPMTEGRITLDGLPLEEGSIRMTPADGKGQTAGTGIVAGRYEMTASPGRMKVIINSPRKAGKMLNPAGDGGRNTIDRYIDSVPPRYNEATELEVTVKPGRNRFDFALEGRVQEEAQR